jgi:hypothetical protein
MEFTLAERRFLHRAHGEIRLNKLLTVEEFVEIGCPVAFAEATVARELEKRSRQLGKKFQDVRKHLNDPIMDKVEGTTLF